MRFDRIQAFVERLAPACVCDACVESRLEIADQRKAVTMLNELAGTAGFERLVGLCALCGETTQVLRHK